MYNKLIINHPESRCLLTVCGALISNFKRQIVALKCKIHAYITQARRT